MSTAPGCEKCCREGKEEQGGWGEPAEEGWYQYQRSSRVAAVQQQRRVMMSSCCCCPGVLARMHAHAARSKGAAISAYCSRKIRGSADPTQNLRDCKAVAHAGGQLLLLT
jgi:hypothetical protein